MRMVIDIDNFVSSDYSTENELVYYLLAQIPNMMLLKISKISRAKFNNNTKFAFSELIFLSPCQLTLSIFVIFGSLLYNKD